MTLEESSLNNDSGERLKLLRHFYGGLPTEPTVYRCRSFNLKLIIQHRKIVSVPMASALCYGNLFNTCTALTRRERLEAKCPMMK